MAPICVHRLRYHNECPAGDNEADADPAASRRHPACRFLLGPLVAGFQRRPPVGWSAHRGTIFKNAAFALSMRAPCGGFSTHTRNRSAFACRAGQSRRRTAGENPCATSETYTRNRWRSRPKYRRQPAARHCRRPAGRESADATAQFASRRHRQAEHHHGLQTAQHGGGRSAARHRADAAPYIDKQRAKDLLCRRRGEGAFQSDCAGTLARRLHSRAVRPSDPPPHFGAEIIFRRERRTQRAASDIHTPPRPPGSRRNVRLPARGGSLARNRPRRRFTEEGLHPGR